MSDQLPPDAVVAIKDVRDRLERSQPRGKGGECWSASFALCVRLTRLDYCPKLVQGSVSIGGTLWPHYWVELLEMRIDLTADQFKHEPGLIVIEPATEDGNYAKEKVQSIDFESLLYYMG